MKSTRRTVNVRAQAIGVAVVAALVPTALLSPSSAADPSLGQLNSQLSQQQAQASGLSASISHLNGLIGSLGSQIAFVQQREASVQAELAQDRLELARVSASLAGERRLLRILIARLGRARRVLASQLVSSYEGDKPDLVSVVLESHGFSDLLDKIQYLRSAEHEQNVLIAVTRSARQQADGAAQRLAVLEQADRQMTLATAGRVQALAGMNSLLSTREVALQDARTAQSAALSAAQARGQALQSQIGRVEAQQAAAERAAAASPTLVTPVSYGSSGASGSWVIPSSVVACESGGQNLTPNGAGASGYYQIVPGTWRQYGGSGPAAYLAPKSEQDAVAQRIWGGGSGAGNWTCATELGVH